MRLEQLRQLAVLEKQLSISKAAKILYMTQPALSMSLTSLESELGATLFERRANGIIPTVIEKEISCFVHNILQDMDRLEGLKKRYEQGEEIVIASVPISYDAVLLRVMKMMRAYPHLKIKILALEPDKVLESLCTGQSDIAVTGYHERQWEQAERQLKSKKLSYEELYAINYRLCVRWDDPLASKENPLVYDDFKDRRLILHRHNADTLRKCGERQKQMHTDRIIVDDTEVQKRLILEGFGIGIVNDIIHADDLYFAPDRLVLKPLETSERIIGCLIYDKQKFNISALQRVIIHQLQRGNEAEIEQMCQ